MRADRFAPGAQDWWVAPKVRLICGSRLAKPADRALIAKLSRPSAGGDRLDWQAASVRVDWRVAAAGDTAAASVAFAGIAETGTLMLLSGPENPITLNFLPDSHLVVLSETDLVGSFEGAWSRLRASHPRLPGTVNLFTGPSRSADIEQKLQLGAHGPIRLHILLLAHATAGESEGPIDV